MSNNISKETLQRLVKDIKDIINEPLEDNGIYYKHDLDNILKGYALIIGPRDTPYFGGFYFFHFIFPYNYPFQPPKVLFKTNTKGIRFNPNLYTNGKVCLSVLNTWSGEKWSSCQNIKSVLLSIFTLFNNNPLTNEPGVNFSINLCNKYTRVIKYANILHCYCGIIKKNIYEDFFSFFEKELKTNFLKNYEEIFENVKNTNISESSVITFDFYKFTINLDYANLIESLRDCYLLLNEN